MTEARTDPTVLLVDQDMESAAAYDFAAGRVLLRTNRMPGKETANEDAVALIPFAPGRGVIAVADGVGGRPSGDLASALALQALRASITEAALAGDFLRESILNGIERANRVVLERGGGGATTLSIAEVREDAVRSYHVGDSLILITGQRGRVRMQTVAHSPIGYAVESGLLGEREAMVHEDRHLISNMIGASDMRIEIGPVLRMARRDTLLIASDGLSDNLTSDELVDSVRKGALDDVAARLHATASRRMAGAPDGHPSKPDDLSFVLFRRRL
ncbi:MAG TPA: protein phosphatase 2C domain-containing protein [Planctomycetota bacterium]